MRKTWLVVGIDKHKPFQGDLKKAEHEAETVAALLSKGFKSQGAGQEFRGSQATKDQLMPHFGEANIIHLATHGEINDTYERGGIRLAVPAGVKDDDVNLQPLRSAVESGDTTVTTRSVADLRESVKQWQKSKELEEKIVLSAMEISRMDLKAQLVVLSACQSADGVILGDGVAGFGRALLLAGVPCTVLSLWPVSDSATVAFMTEFYEGLVRGGSVADAIKTAMITMINATYDYNSKKRKTEKVGQWAPFWVFGLPNVRVANPTVAPPSPKSLRTNSVPQIAAAIVLGFLSLAFAKKAKSKMPVLTRSAASEASEQYAWNPPCFGPEVPTKPTNRGRRLGLRRRQLMIFGFLTFHLFYRGLLDHDEAALSEPLPSCI